MMPVNPSEIDVEARESFGEQPFNLALFTTRDLRLSGEKLNVSGLASVEGED